MTPSILFVCTGNICRSPLAEGIFIDLAQKANFKVHVESAGTSNWHHGEDPDPRSIEIAKKNQIVLPSKAQPLKQSDFENFSYLVAMDHSHYDHMKVMSNKKYHSKIKLMRDYDLPKFKGKDVPDPYYGGKKGFEEVYNMLVQSCQSFLKFVSYQ